MCEDIRKAALMLEHQSGAKVKRKGAPFHLHFNRKMEVLQMITYLGAVALGFVLGAVFSAVGLLADRKGARR